VVRPTSQAEEPASAIVLAFTGFGGLSLAADAYGSPEDPAVLLLHGGGQTRRSWRAAARALAAAGRYAIALDLRGHGDSEWATDGRYDLAAFAADVRAVLSSLQTRPAVVGASIGGLAALAALSENGETLASGLVLVDAAPWMDAEASARTGAALRRHGEGFADLDEALAAAREVSNRPFASAEALRPHLREAPDGRFHWRWDPRFLNAFDLSDATRLEPAAARLNMPVLIVRGEESQVVSHETAIRFRDLMPDAEVAEIEGAGHLVAVERLEMFNATLLEFLEKRLPRAPLSFEQGSDARMLRDVLGCFGTGVIVATTLDALGKPVGLTANSFTSVSLDPPLVLFCLAKSAGSLPHFDRAQAWGVNVLHIGQQPVSARFAKRGEERFEVTPWEQWETGAPIISGSLASLECTPFARHEAGDHVVFIGEVKRARFEPRRDPLLYFRGRYRRLHLV
jgi:flavin reductase (DIM6/NTAB) family NADH-FMN oxidoreductase RutF/pimeloyl-ACP methyl ester carboxylesterase